MKKEIKEKIITAFLGIMVLCIAIYLGFVILQTQSDCLQQIADKYPNVSCVSADYIYCEWNNKTYHIVGDWEEDKYLCDLKEVEK